MSNMKEIPLFVDLDGTYTKTNLLLESFIIAIKKNPFVIFYCISWLLKGKETLKYQLSELADIDTNTLPLNPQFLYFLIEEKKKDRLIYLATASNEKYAKDILNNTNIFDGYISSCKEINLTGKKKLQKIKAITDNYAYAGNECIDFEIFEQADQSLLVNPSANVMRKARKLKIDRFFDVKKFDISVWLKQLRTHQWLKNLLLFVPLVISGRFADPNDILIIVYALIAFNFLASSTYIINDLLDLESDRNHARKKSRPLAAGSIGIKEGTFASCLLLAFATSLSIFIGDEFTQIFITYLFLTLIYSFKLKRCFGIDVICLAVLYTIRILAGAAAIGVTVSLWLLTFSGGLFLSLALVKRCSEIQLMNAERKKQIVGRAYSVGHYSILISFGISSAILAICIFFFYIKNNILIGQYSQPYILWLTFPALCYWLIRVWIKTLRGQMHDDPIEFSLKDKISLVIASFCGLIVIAAQVL